MIRWFEILVDYRQSFRKCWKWSKTLDWICYLDIVQKKNGREFNGQVLWSHRFESPLFLRQDTHTHGRFICFLALCLIVSDEYSQSFPLCYLMIMSWISLLWRNWSVLFKQCMIIQIQWLLLFVNVSTKGVYLNLNFTSTL